MAEKQISVAECITRRIQDYLSESPVKRDAVLSLEWLSSTLWEEGHLPDTEHAAILELSDPVTHTLQQANG